jgi:hypothetical protein
MINETEIGTLSFAELSSLLAELGKVSIEITNYNISFGESIWLMLTDATGHKVNLHCDGCFYLKGHFSDILQLELKTCEGIQLESCEISSSQDEFCLRFRSAKRLTQPTEGGTISSVFIDYQLKPIADEFLLAKRMACRPVHIWLISYSQEESREAIFSFHSGHAFPRVMLAFQNCHSFCGDLKGGPYQLEMVASATVPNLILKSTSGDWQLQFAQAFEIVSPSSLPIEKWDFAMDRKPNI